LQPIVKNNEIKTIFFILILFFAIQALLFILCLVIPHPTLTKVEGVVLVLRVAFY